MQRELLHSPPTKAATPASTGLDIIHACGSCFGAFQHVDPDRVLGAVIFVRVIAFHPRNLSLKIGLGSCFDQALQSLMNSGSELLSGHELSSICSHVTSCFIGF